MEIYRDGSFSMEIKFGDLARGLRQSSSSPRNVEYLVECIGAVGIDNVLQVLDDLNEGRIDTAVITDDFPYPQIFILTDIILVCGSTDIYTLANNILTKVIGPVTAGQLWTLVDFSGFIYMSNGTVSILKYPFSGTFSLTSDQPVTPAMCNYNGQVVAAGRLCSGN